jgi:acyl-CoA thioesterase-1
VNTDHRICFVGDSFVQGTADETALGWVDRVAAAGRRDGHDITAYNLGVRRDTSADIRNRWFAECTARMQPECRYGTVLSFGANDMTPENGGLRVAVNESVANLAAIVTGARKLGAVLIIGPLPVNDVEQDRRIIALCSRYAEVCAALDVPYLPLARRFKDDAQWQRAVAKGDGTHPDSSGYSLIADQVLRWPAWWLSAPSSPE